MSNGYRAIIIDDESKCIEILKHLIETYCPEINIIGSCGTVKDGIELINSTLPEIVFIDISLPDGDGFSILEQSEFKEFKIVFVTAYHEYAIKAFKYSAFDYLLKPINPDELRSTIDRIIEAKIEDFDQKVQVYKEVIKKNLEKILLPTANELIIINLNQVIRCEAEGNYTNFYLNGGNKMMICKPLNIVELLLDGSNFSRVHKKHLINLEYFKKYKKGRGGIVVLADDSHVDVSEAKKPFFLDKLKEFAQIV